MGLHRSNLLHGLVIAVSVGVFVMGARMVTGVFVDDQNRKLLTDLTDRILERAEKAVDYAFISLTQLAEKGLASCTESDLGEIRRQVYQRGTIKDIRVVQGTSHVLCSAFPGTLAFDTATLPEIEKFRSRNFRVSLFRLEQRSASSLGLLWELADDLSLVAVVNADALLFDMLPSVLRDSSYAYIKLGDESVIASYAPDDPAAAASQPVAFSSASTRYPLRASVYVDADALARWNDSVPLPILTLAGVLGLAFGLLLSKVFQRPDSQLAEMDRALAAGEFVPYLQPIFSLADERIVGCEALARWQRADGSIGAPQYFIPLAERSGRIVPLTRQLIGKALADLAPVLRADKAFKISFNIVPAHFWSAGFVDEMCALAAEAQVGTGQIVIELTERQQLQDLAGAAAVIAQLRGRGFKVAIDDTGTGHNGLSYIHKLGVDALKIDKLFIDSVGKDHTARAVVEMLVKLARELDMTTVAEGIETREQIALLRDYGVDEGQGFVVARPLPAQRFLALVAANRDGTAAAPLVQAA